MDEARKNELIEETQEAHLWGADKLVQVFPMKLKAILDNEAWLARGFESFYELALARIPKGLGLDGRNLRITYEQAIAYCQVMHKDTAGRMRGAMPAAAAHGGDRKTDARDQDSNTTLNNRGSSYLTRRLKRDAPKIAAALVRGEYKSVRQAAIAAGIVKPPSALQVLKRDWAKATERERRAFFDWAEKRLDEAIADA